MVAGNVRHDLAETADNISNGVYTAGDGIENAITLTVNLVKACVANHTLSVAQLGVLLEQTYRTVLGLTTFRAERADIAPVETSDREDSIMYLECGKLFRSLKRHLAAHHWLTPPQYRICFNLPSDFSMIAPEYAASRSRLAISIGLGEKPGQKHKRRPRQK